MDKDTPAQDEGDADYLNMRGNWFRRTGGTRGGGVGGVIETQLLVNCMVALRTVQVASATI